MQKSVHGYTFKLVKVIKQSRPGKNPPVIELRAYQVDRRLCIVTVLNEYLMRRKLKAQKDEHKLGHKSGDEPRLTSVDTLTYKLCYCVKF